MQIQSKRVYGIAPLFSVFSPTALRGTLNVTGCGATATETRALFLHARACLCVKAYMEGARAVWKMIL